MLSGNPMHALRKLSLPDVDLGECQPGTAGHVLIHNAPVLEHLKVQDIRCAQAAGHSEVCVPWRILEVPEFLVDINRGLPRGSCPGQPPLILRVTESLWCSDLEFGADRLVSPPPSSSRRVQLECTRAVYHTISNVRHVAGLPATLRVLTLCGDLSNLILDGIDSADDIRGLVDVSEVGLAIIMDDTSAAVSLPLGELAGLHDLPRVTKVEFRANHPGSWVDVDEELLGVLPAHITAVRLSGCPSLEVLARMCVHVSGLPHRQAHPLRLCVPGVPGWFDAMEAAMGAAGIHHTGILGLPNAAF